jgi:hypothetical protein
MFWRRGPDQGEGLCLVGVGDDMVIEVVKTGIVLWKEGGNIGSGCHSGTYTGAGKAMAMKVIGGERVGRGSERHCRLAVGAGFGW